MPRKNPYSYPLMLKPFLAISVCQAGDCSCHQAWRKAGMFGRCDQSTSSLRGNQALLPCLWGTSATIVGQACVNVHAYMHVHNPNHGNIIGKDQCRKLRQFSFQSQMDLKGGAYIYIYMESCYSTAVIAWFRFWFRVSSYRRPFVSKISCGGALQWTKTLEPILTWSWCSTNCRSWDVPESFG